MGAESSASLGEVTFVTVNFLASRDSHFLKYFRNVEQLMLCKRLDFPRMMVDGRHLRKALVQSLTQSSTGLIRLQRALINQGLKTFRARGITVLMGNLSLVST